MFPLAQALARARRRLIVRRLPLFAASWIGAAVVWAVVLRIEGLASTPLAALLPASQAAVLGVAYAVARVDSRHARVPPTTAVAMALLGIVFTVFFAGVRGDGDILAFVLLTLYLLSALFFATGWQTALAVLAATFVPWLVAGPRLRFYLPTTELAAAIGIGSTVSLAIAEVSKRTFGIAFERGERERQATQALAASRDAYRDLAENASDLLYTHDLAGRLTYANAAFARFAGVSAEALVGRACQDLMVDGPEAPDVAAIIARVAAGEAVPPIAAPVVFPDGMHWLECAISAIHDTGGTVIGVRGIARDVTAKRHAEEQLRASLGELRQSEEMLRLLARRQATIREEERKRIGFDLHDDVCQELVGIGILLEAVRRRLGDVAPREDDGLAEIVRYLHEVVEHLRGLAHDLRPLLLRDLGLEGSLQSLADGMSTPATRAVVDFPARVPRLDEHVEIDVYRIAQEALANAVRHAQAQTIRVRLGLVGSVLELEVRDDGCGFVSGERRKPRLGLVGMHERALALGGRLTVTSAPALGTIVHLECPITLPALAAAT